jgi:hypothetical protein
MFSKHRHNNTRERDFYFELNNENAACMRQTLTWFYLGVVHKWRFWYCGLLLTPSILWNYTVNKNSVIGFLWCCYLWTNPLPFMDYITLVLFSFVRAIKENSDFCRFVSFWNKKNLAKKVRIWLDLKNDSFYVGYFSKKCRISGFFVH